MVAIYRVVADSFDARFWPLRLLPLADEKFPFIVHRELVVAIEELR